MRLMATHLEVLDTRAARKRNKSSYAAANGDVRKRNDLRNAAAINTDVFITHDQYGASVPMKESPTLHQHASPSPFAESTPDVDAHNMRTTFQLAVATKSSTSMLLSPPQDHRSYTTLPFPDTARKGSPASSSLSHSHSSNVHAAATNSVTSSDKDVKKPLNVTVTDTSSPPPHPLSRSPESGVITRPFKTRQTRARRRKGKDDCYQRRNYHRRSGKRHSDIGDSTVGYRKNNYRIKDLRSGLTYMHCGKRTQISTGRNGLLILLAMAALFGIGGSNERSHTVVNISADKQTAWLEQARIECFEEILRVPWPDDNVTVCPRTWDLVMCWPDTKPGQIATQPCPSYVNGFQPWENATRRCMPDGTWYFDADLNRTWTNMSLCLSELFLENGSEFVKSHMGRIVFMYSLGYGISLASLGLSLFIMLYFKRLHCPRNYIHLNLFVSFILRASISFMKQKLLVAGLGFPSDVEPDEFDENKFIFKNGSTHWQCKLFFTCFNYILGANYMWILAEGIYLQLLISRAVFSEKSSVKWYMLFGWLSPLIFVIPWVIVRILKEDVYCWNTHPTVGYFWIMRGPIVLSILINFFFFLNIIRVLFTKLNAVNSPEARRFRKLARSTLVLIPLFGVHYMVFLVLPTTVNPTAELVQLYFEMFFNSTQGFFVAVLYCFVNGEVRNEIRKKWHRFNLMHLNHVASSRTNYSSSHTFASYLSRATDSGRRGSRFTDSHDSHQISRDGTGRSNGSRGRLLRQNNSQHTFPNRESATMLLPLKHTSSSTNGGDVLVKENGLSAASETGIFISNGPRDNSEVCQDERSSFC